MSLLTKTIDGNVKDQYITDLRSIKITDERTNHNGTITSILGSITAESEDIWGGILSADRGSISVNNTIDTKLTGKTVSAKKATYTTVNASEHIKINDTYSSTLKTEDTANIGKLHESELTAKGDIEVGSMNKGSSAVGHNITTGEVLNSSTINGSGDVKASSLWNGSQASGYNVTTGIVVNSKAIAGNDATTTGTVIHSEVVAGNNASCPDVKDNSCVTASNKATAKSVSQSTISAPHVHVENGVKTADIICEKLTGGTIQNSIVMQHLENGVFKIIKVGQKEIPISDTELAKQPSIRVDLKNSISTETAMAQEKIPFDNNDLINMMAFADNCR